MYRFERLVEKIDALTSAQRLVIITVSPKSGAGAAVEAKDRVSHNIADSKRLDVGARLTRLIRIEDVAAW